MAFWGLFLTVETVCAVAIQRQWRHAPWIYLVGCFCLLAWAVLRLAAFGFSISTMAILLGSLLSATGFYWLREAERKNKIEEEADDSEAPLELTDEQQSEVDAVTEAYSKAFGEARWEHHIVPKSLWLHPYAEHVITFAPTEGRPTWLYGTLLVSALSGTRVELIIERPEQDTIGAIGTLSRLIEYHVDHSPLAEWHTIGEHPFLGEDSAVRGLLICRPPACIPSSISAASEEISLLYVAGITGEQLAAAQATDDENGDLAGAKALHAKLRISDQGIANLPD